MTPSLDLGGNAPPPPKSSADGVLFVGCRQDLEDALACVSSPIKCSLSTTRNMRSTVGDVCAKHAHGTMLHKAHRSCQSHVFPGLVHLKPYVGRIGERGRGAEGVRGGLPKHVCCFNSPKVPNHRVPFTNIRQKSPPLPNQALMSTSMRGKLHINRSSSRGQRHQRVSQISRRSSHCQDPHHVSANIISRSPMASLSCAAILFAWSTVHLFPQQWLSMPL